jgi:hypothetical protein
VLPRFRPKLGGDKEETVAGVSISGSSRMVEVNTISIMSLRGAIATRQSLYAWLPGGGYCHANTCNDMAAGIKRIAVTGLRSNAAVKKKRGPASAPGRVMALVGKGRDCAGFAFLLLLWLRQKK